MGLSQPPLRSQLLSPFVCEFLRNDHSRWVKSEQSVPKVSGVGENVCTSGVKAKARYWSNRIF